ncbi:MAG: ABC-F family ATP-binding cassette domain-containing protein [Dysgonamonadaceae bacterium]|nr:ABC-F family ATP-binding cassette domain-containing protein [Dysgonamonadaceae bacterium]MDD4727726.1 ABC-F family ATP-binding cassette domain-containing protein [Dysgonamonadaceae bacterium]
MVSVDNLNVEFGGFTLFDEVSFVLNKNERIALVGKNGAGKSTLLKIIAGLQKPTGGVISYPKEVTIGYLPQQMKPNNTRTVKDESSMAFAHLIEMQDKLNGMHQEMAERTDFESEDYMNLIDRSSLLQEQLLMSGINNFEAEIEKTLIGLGFLRSDFDRPTSEFSGGWRMRIELAKLLMQSPDVLLLDEPTNHLDIESIQWLERFLARSANAVMLVSHDRAFLDAVTNRTIEISLGQIFDYKVNYSQYVVLREERREQQMRAFENQQKQIEDTEAFIERFRYQATKAIQVQSRIKQLNKLQRVEVDEVDTSNLSLKFPPSPRSGSYPVIIENLEKKYGDHTVISNVEFTINRGEKIAFVGKNGEGKSTLVKCIMNEIDYTGKMKLGHNVKIGYFAQNQAQLLREDLTVFETIDYVATGEIRTKIRSILGAFMFGGEASDKHVRVLSGGEKSRLAMIRLLLEPVNLLILDEPTNHLDMASKDVLKQAILDFDGTAIIVSHDRDFLEGLVTKVYEFGGGKVVEHMGGIYDFLEKKNMESLQQLELSKNHATSVADENKDTISENKLSYEEQREQNRLIRRQEKKIEDLEDEIHRFEKKTKQIETELSTPEGAANSELYQSHLDAQERITSAMKEWEKAINKLEDLNNNM